MSQHAIDMPCIADTWLDAGNSSSVHGSDTQLKSGWSEYPSSQILMKFNFSSLPARKKIVSAKINAYNLVAKTLSAYGIMTCGNSLRDWIESTATYDNANSGYSTDQPGFGLLSLPANQYIEIDVTALSNLQYNTKGFCINWNDPFSVSNKYILIASRETANPPFIRIIYEDVPPDKPSIKYPNGQFIDNTSVIRFAWDYISSVGGAQKKFDLQYSLNNGTSWTTISQTTENTCCDMPANTLPSGTVMWKVQTYNDYDEGSGYSDIYSFYSIGAPAVPSIYSITNNTAKPVLNWTATQQEVYQLQILKDNIVIYDTGNKPYKEYSHKVNTFLSDGTYTAKLRVQNEYELWSVWAETQFQIVTEKPVKPDVIFQLVRNGIEAIITNSITSVYFLLLKNEIPVYKSSEKILYDYTAENGTEYQYKVRAVSSNDTFIDSDIKILSTQVISNVFAPVSNLGNILEFICNLNQQPDKNYNSAVVINSMYVSGRKFSIVEKSEHLEKGLSFTFYSEKYAEILKLDEMVQGSDTILFRDSKGKKLYGEIVNLRSSEVKKGYQVSFAINAVDYMEGIYD